MEIIINPGMKIHLIEAGKIKYLQQILNSDNGFLLLLVMSYVGSRFKLLRMYCYKSMKPLSTKLK